MSIISPILLTTMTTSLVALIPKALSDAYDYVFGGETIQIRKKPDMSKFTDEDYCILYQHYKIYKINKTDYKTQAEFVAAMNKLLGMDKSIGQMLRACKKAELENLKG